MGDVAKCVKYLWLGPSSKNWRVMRNVLPTLTYADPVGGAVVALVAFCLVRRRHGSAREVMTNASGELTFRICRSVLAWCPACRRR